MGVVAAWKHRPWAVALLGLTLFTAHCDGGTRATPPARFAARSGEVPRDSLLAYAATLTFDTSHGSGDEQPLPWVDDSGRLVAMPNVRVESEIGAALLTRRQLAQGRIIARYIAEGPYPPLGIAPGINYVWVDSTGDGFREQVVSEDAANPIVTRPLRIVPHSPLAGVVAPRWVVTPDYLWGCRPCVLQGWCPSGSVRTTGWLDALTTTPTERMP